MPQNPRESQVTLAEIAVVQDAQAIEAAKLEALKAFKATRQWVVAVNADMLHLYTGLVISSTPSLHTVDDFLFAQIAADKVRVVGTPE